jgi:hypothetical protein
MANVIDLSGSFMRSSQWDGGEIEVLKFCCCALLWIFHPFPLVVSHQANVKDDDCRIC